MTPFGYSAEVWRRFQETPRAGTLAGGGVHTANATTNANRNRLRLQVKMSATRIDDARFQAYGCPTTIAVGAWLAEKAIGRELGELERIDSKMIREALEIPEDRTHCALLGEDLLKALLAVAR